MGVVAEYVKVVSGSGKKDRVQFEQMMLAASQRKFDLLVFWALDRLSREGIVKTLGYLEQLTAWGIANRSDTQPFLDTGNEMNERHRFVRAGSRGEAGTNQYLDQDEGRAPTSTQGR
jgi:DNA invertase Pin-like site-specific DNA recombinase